MTKDAKKSSRQRYREFLSAAFGGQCTICGYGECVAALDYHHLDPNEKDKNLSIAMRDGHAWHRIVEEARKCTILCCRCHREVHAGHKVVPVNCTRFNEEYSDLVKLKRKEFDDCPVCGELKHKARGTCSLECSGKIARKFDPSKEELEQLIAVEPYELIGKRFGVSGNAVRKRCKKLGIKLESRRGYWSQKKMIDASVV